MKTNKPVPMRAATWYRTSLALGLTTLALPSTSSVSASMTAKRSDLPLPPRSTARISFACEPARSSTTVRT